MSVIRVAQEDSGGVGIGSECEASRAKDGHCLSVLRSMIGISESVALCRVISTSTTHLHLLP